MKVVRNITIERDIKRCYHECPYFDVEGMEHAMVCRHPKAPGEPPYQGLIISHPDCMTGFPKECPLTQPQPTDGPRSNEHTLIH